MTLVPGLFHFPFSPLTPSHLLLTCKKFHRHWEVQERFVIRAYSRRRAVPGSACLSSETWDVPRAPPVHRLITPRPSLCDLSTLGARRVSQPGPLAPGGLGRELPGTLRGAAHHMRPGKQTGAYGECSILPPFLALPLRPARLSRSQDTISDGAHPLTGWRDQLKNAQ